MATSGSGHPTPLAPQESALLTQTLSASTTIKCILPAKLRYASRQDVIFVGDTWVQLQEFVTTPEPHLLDVTGIFNLPCPILATKVISATAESIDFLEQVRLQTVEEERYMVDGKPLRNDLPPQIVVLSLASSELMFAYVNDNGDGSYGFRWARRRLLSGIDVLDSIGRHLAVDPASLALAVAPSRGYFAVASLRDLDGIRQAINEQHQLHSTLFSPWLEQHFIQIDGYIVKMDFLQTADRNPSKVILVLLVANAGQTSLVVYCWDVKSPLSSIRPMRSSGQILHQEDSFPLMLIPCRGLASFFAVTESELVLYSQITSSTAQRSAYPLPAQETPSSPASRRRLLWTQWAKPYRHRQYVNTNDDVMLVREDGLIHLFIVAHAPQPKAILSTPAGRLEMHVDTAFCMLPTPHSMGGGDILIAGGDLDDGGLFHLEPRKGPRRIQALSNAAPFTDLLLLSDGATTHPVPGTQRMLASCGREDGRGSLAQIHHGLEAQVGWTMEHSDVASIERIWTVEVPNQHMLFMIFSHSLHSSLIVYNIKTTELEYAESASFPYFCYDSATIAVARLDENSLVQVTVGGVYILPLSQESSRAPTSTSTAKLLCAAILERLGIVIVAYAAPDDFELGCINLQREHLEQGGPVTSFSLGSEPVALHATYWGEIPLIFVATKPGRITAFLFGAERCQLAPLVHDLHDTAGVGEDATATSLRLLTHPASDFGVLICGLRCGVALCVKLKATKRKDKKIHLQSIGSEVYRLGLTTVSIQSDDATALSQNTAAALGICGARIQRFLLRLNTAGVDVEVAAVFITERGRQTTQFPTINAICRVCRLESDPQNDISGLLLCATPDAVLFTSLVTQTSAIMQHTPLPGIPNRLIFLPYLKQVAVGTNALPGPMVTFVVPPAEGTDAPSFTIIKHVSVGKSNDKIQDLVNHRPMKGQVHQEFLVIAINSRHADAASRAFIMTGSIVRISLKSIRKATAGEDVKIRAHSIMNFPGKAVTALGVCGRSGLLICVENKLILQDLDIETREWRSLSDFELPSPASQICLREGGSIVVVTRDHGTMLLRESQGKLTLIGADQQARNMRGALVYAGRKILVSSIGDKGTIVTGLIEDPRAGSLSTSFAATVPSHLQRVLVLEHFGTKRPRRCFVGISADGAMYRFMTLDRPEWELTRWLQDLSMDRTAASKRRKAARAMHHSSTHPDGTQYRRAQINGDCLKALLEEGPSNLHNLLDRHVKLEHDQSSERKQHEQSSQKLRELAVAVVGDHEDTIGTVMIWLRKLLDPQTQ